MQLVLGYVACLLCFDAYLLPRLVPWTASTPNAPSPPSTASASSGSSSSFPASSAPTCPAAFATFAAYGDFATGVLALLALLTVEDPSALLVLRCRLQPRRRVDLIVDYYHAIRSASPPSPASWARPTSSPSSMCRCCMITHVVALYWLARPQPAAHALAGTATAS